MAFGAELDDSDELEESKSQDNAASKLPESVGIPVTLFSNFFKVVNHPDLTLTKFSASVEPAIPEGEMQAFMLRKLFQMIGRQLREALPWHVRLGLDIYAPTNMVNQTDTLTFSAEIDAQNYCVVIRLDRQAILWSDDIHLYYRVMQRVFDQILGSLKFQKVGRALFDVALARENELLGIDIWPGHQASLSLRENGIMLQVSSVHQVIRRTETCLDKIRQIRDINEARGRDYQREVADAVVGRDIVTVYNKRAYRVDDVAFDKTPDSTFMLVKQGEEYHVSFADYLRSQHRVEVVEANQPMLVVFDIRNE